MTRPRAARSFIIRLPLTFVIAMACWLILRPALDVAVTGLGGVLVRAFEYPRVTRLEAVDHSARVFRSDFRTNSAIPTIPLTEIHFNTIILLALFLALPKRFSRRHLERLVMAWSLLYLTQTLNLVFHVKCLYALGLGDWSQQTYSDFARNFYGFWRYFTDLPGRFGFPFLFWLAFFWESVVAMLGATPEAATARARPPKNKKPANS